MITNEENNMIRTQIQLTPEQVRWLKRRAAMEKKSVADLIRTSLDEMMRETILPDVQELRAKALASAGTLSGPRILHLIMTRTFQKRCHSERFCGHLRFFSRPEQERPESSTGEGSLAGFVIKGNATGYQQLCAG